MVEFEADFGSVIEDLNAIASRELENAINKELDEFGERVVKSARSHHRFRTRSGNLINSIKKMTSQYSMTAYIDDGQAKYGKYIHEGTRHIPPDPFLQEAIDREAPKEVKRLEDVILKVFKRKGF